MACNVLWLFIVLQIALIYAKNKKQLVAMDRIILANMGKG
jgi:hypothetical protein